MQSRKQYVLFHAACVGFDPLQNACMKRVEKIAIAQQKANHLRPLFENPAGLRIGSKSKTADCIKHPRARFPAYLRAGIQHARNRSDAYARSAGYFANRGFSWNRFHENWVLVDLSQIARKLPCPSSVRKSNTPSPLT